MSPLTALLHLHGQRRIHTTIAADQEEKMIKFVTIMAIGALAIAAPAMAGHIGYLGVAFADNGACESTRQSLSNDDDGLLDRFPGLFSSAGEVRSFLNRAFTCEPDSSGQYYIIDHRQEVIDSEWFQRRL